ncbi:MAG: hypothetical protein ACOCXA_06730, partial [Planctomycetota bacterium]
QAVRIAVLQGPALMDGQPLADTHHRGGIISLAADARIHVRWSDGHEAQVLGPATCSVHRDGLSLQAGTCRVRTADADLRIGLPERPVRMLAKSDCVISSQADGGIVAVHAGQARMLAGMHHQSDILLEQQQWSDGSAPAPWLVLDDWRSSPPLPDHVRRWQLELGLICQDQAVAMLAGVEGTLLQVAGGAIHLPGSERRLKLPGPPRQQQDLVLRAHADGVDLYLDGDSEALVSLPPQAPPIALQLRHGAICSTSRLRVGPASIPWHRSTR